MLLVSPWERCGRSRIPSQINLRVQYLGSMHAYAAHSYLAGIDITLPTVSTYIKRNFVPPADLHQKLLKYPSNKPRRLQIS